MDINTNTILLLIILLGIAYIIYRKYDDDRKAKKNDQKANLRARLVNNKYILAHSNGVVPYYGYGYRRWYW
jgi:hypothetical protein